jgi:hypothetical protein
MHGKWKSHSAQAVRTDGIGTENVPKTTRKPGTGNPRSEKQLELLVLGVVAGYVGQQKDEGSCVGTLSVLVGVTLVLALRCVEDDEDSCSRDLEDAAL